MKAADYSRLSGSRFFTILTALFALSGLLILLLLPKGEVVQRLNGSYTAFGDIFFRYVTHLGDGLAAVLLLLLVVLFSYRAAIMLVVVDLMQLLVSQLSKRILFSDMERPRAHFDAAGLHFVQGVDVHTRFSFPSGHTLTAFSLATFFVLLFPERPRVALLAFVYACLVGSSRIYLAQHYFMDVYAGALLGVFFTAALFMAFSTQQWYHSPGLKAGLLKRV